MIAGALPEGKQYHAVVVAPNSAIDSYYVLSGLEIGSVNRAVNVVHTAGGKGINLARALINLGGRALSLGIAGGFAGKFIFQEMEKDGIDQDLVWVEQETRRCSTFIYPGSVDNTVLLEPGRPVGEAAQQELSRRIIEHAQKAPYLILTGSLPPDFPVSYYADMINQAKIWGLPVFLDCSDEPLQAAAQAGPALIKVNYQEFSAAFGLPEDHLEIQSIEEWFKVASKAGLATLIITDGERGAYLFSNYEPVLHVITEVGSFISSAGAGDTFLAAFLLAKGCSLSLAESARLASAAAAANLQHIGCGILTKADFDFYLGKTHVNRINHGEYPGDL